MDTGGTNQARSIRAKSIRGTGKVASDSVEKIKAVPRKERCGLFVGRLSKETSEADVKAYMESLGVEEFSCKKLSSKDGREFSTSAFHVTCACESRDKVFCADNWPDSAEVREWVFYNK